MRWVLLVATQPVRTHGVNWTSVLTITGLITSLVVAIGSSLGVLVYKAITRGVRAPAENLAHAVDTLADVVQRQGQIQERQGARLDEHGEAIAFMQGHELGRRDKENNK